jgi:hypothetical protein
MEKSAVSKELFYWSKCRCGIEWQGKTVNQNVPESVDKEITEHQKTCYNMEEVGFANES